MNEEERLKNHIEVSKKNPIFMKYFCNRNIFHDCLVDRIKHYPQTAVLDIFIKLNQYDEIDSENNIAQIQFSRILDVKFENYPWNYIAQESVDKINWKKFLIPGKKEKQNEFLYCWFDYSKHEDFAEKHLMKNCYKGTVVLSNWINIVINFVELKVKLPFELREKKLFNLHDDYYSLK